jgi:hypothetical protein
MKRIIGFALSALLLGGCAAYVEPVAPSTPPPAGVYVAPPPVVVVPGPYPGVDGTAAGITTGADRERNTQRRPARSKHARGVSA